MDAVDLTEVVGFPIPAVREVDAAVDDIEIAELIVGETAYRPHSPAVSAKRMRTVVVLRRQKIDIERIRRREVKSDPAAVAGDSVAAGGGTAGQEYEQDAVKKPDQRPPR